jgi:hypothetical protein
MKSHRLVLSVVLMSLSAVAFAQSDMQKSDAQKSDMHNLWLLCRPRRRSPSQP